MRLASLCALFLTLASQAAGQDALAAFNAEPRARVLLLGVFHFNNPGRDWYKAQFPFEIRSPQRQRELEDVLSKLAAWKPTRIAVEALPEQQGRLDSLFREYPGNGLDTLRSETYQVGFRLAQRLSLTGVHAVDAAGRRLDSAMTEQEWNARQHALTRGPLARTNWDARFAALYRMNDSLKSVLTLRETLLHENNPERLRVAHGHYLVGNLLNGAPGDYLGADGFISGWYNRNVRIYSNIVRLIRNQDERVLVIIGAGHAPILRHLFQSSPVLQLEDVGSVLR